MKCKTKICLQIYAKKASSKHESIQVNFHVRYGLATLANFTAFHHSRHLPRCYALLDTALGFVLRGWGQSLEAIRIAKHQEGALEQFITATKSGNTLKQCVEHTQS